MFCCLMSETQSHFLYQVYECDASTAHDAKAKLLFSYLKRVYLPGLPDGLFSNQKYQIWVNFGGPLNGKCWYS
jgi:hypothetical protein